MLSYISNYHQFLKTEAVKTNSYFEDRAWIPLLSLVIGVWKTCILKSELNAIGLDKETPATSVHANKWVKGCSTVMSLRNLSIIFAKGISVDIALAFLAKWIVTAVFPIFSTYLLVASLISLTGRIGLMIYSLIVHEQHYAKKAGTAHQGYYFSSES